MQISYARELLNSARGRLQGGVPHRADVRRAISDAYYAVYHLLVGEAAAMITADGELAKCLARVPQHERLHFLCKQLEPAGTKLSFGKNWNADVPLELTQIASRVRALYGDRINADDSFTIDESKLNAELRVDEAEQTFRDWEKIRDHPTARAFLLFLFVKEPKESNS
jgi:hypothetical protein